jgi:hypothetical protein
VGTPLIDTTMRGTVDSRKDEEHFVSTSQNFFFACFEDFVGLYCSTQGQLPPMKGGVIDGRQGDNNFQRHPPLSGGENYSIKEWKPRNSQHPTGNPEKKKQHDHPNLKTAPICTSSITNTNSNPHSRSNISSTPYIIRTPTSISSVNYIINFSFISS